MTLKIPRLSTGWFILLPAAALLLAFALPTVRTLAMIYETEPNYSHGWVVPLAALFLAYRRRERLPSPGGASSWLGLLPLAGGILLTVLGLWYDVGLRPGYFGYAFLQGFGLMLAVAGVCWTLWGATVRVLALPLAYLCFALPLPGIVINRVALPLQGVAAALSTVVLRILGLAAVKEGHLIRLTKGVLNVEEACSGIRSIWVLLAFAVLLMSLVRMSRVRRLLLLVSIPVLAVLANVIRVVGSGLAVAAARPDLVTGPFHTWFGLGTVALSGAGLLIVANAWRAPAAAPDAQGPSGAPPDRPDDAPRGASFTGTASAAALLLVLGTILQVVVVRHYDIAPARLVALAPSRRTLAEFPAALGRFRMAENRALEPGHTEFLKASDSLYRVYRGQDDEWIVLLLCYWHPQVRSVALRKAFGSFVDQDVCYPFWGWRREDAFTRNAAPAWLPGQTVRSRVFSKEAQREVTVYWYSQAPRPALAKSLLERPRALVESWRSPATIADRQYSVSLTIRTRDRAPEDVQALGFEFAEALAPLLPDYGMSPASSVAGHAATDL